MKIGIIGAGHIGGNLARLWAPQHQVLVSFSRSPEKLAALAREAGPTVQPGSPAEAVRFADVLVVSVPFALLGTVLAPLGDLTGKVLIDTNNPFGLTLPPGTTGADEVRRLAPGARLVKAFNTLRVDALLHHSQSTPRLAMPLAGDDSIAKITVARLIADAGFAPLDLGGLDAVPLQESQGPFFNKELTLEQAEQLLANARSSV